mmetsp:Transcript_5593/g.7215  ORF Transcript_5593/g.7215 Transcript_5593/m.7215 type:complete len:84 (-) Transcript_5593:3-254(-)
MKNNVTCSQAITSFPICNKRETKPFLVSTTAFNTSTRALARRCSRCASIRTSCDPDLKPPQQPHNMTLSTVGRCGCTYFLFLQ